MVIGGGQELTLARQNVEREAIKSLPQEPLSTDIPKAETLYQQGKISEGTLSQYRDVARQNEQIQSNAIWGQVHHGRFGGSIESFKQQYPELASRVNKGINPDQYVGEGTFEFWFPSTSGGLGSTTVGSRESALSEIMRMSARFNPEKVETYNKMISDSQALQSGYRGYFSDDALKVVTAPIGTITDPAVAAKKSMLESPTAQWSSPEIFVEKTKQFEATTGQQGVHLNLPTDEKGNINFYGVGSDAQLLAKKSMLESPTAKWASPEIKANIKSEFEAGKFGTYYQGYQTSKSALEARLNEINDLRKAQLISEGYKETPLHSPEGGKIWRKDVQDIPSKEITSQKSIRDEGGIIDINPATGKRWSEPLTPEQQTRLQMSTWEKITNGMESPRGKGFTGAFEQELINTALGTLNIINIPFEEATKLAPTPKEQTIHNISLPFGYTFSPANFYEKTKRVTNVIDEWTKQADIGSQRIQDWYITHNASDKASVYNALYQAGKGLALNFPRQLVEITGVSPGGAQVLYENPKLIPILAVSGIGMMGESIITGVKERPLQTAGEFIGWGSLGAITEARLPRIPTEKMFGDTGQLIKSYFPKEPTGKFPELTTENMFGDTGTQIKDFTERVFTGKSEKMISKESGMSDIDITSWGESAVIQKELPGITSWGRLHVERGGKFISHAEPLSLSDISIAAATLYGTSSLTQPRSAAPSQESLQKAYEIAGMTQPEKNVTLSEQMRSEQIRTIQEKSQSSLLEKMFGKQAKTLTEKHQADRLSKTEEIVRGTITIDMVEVLKSYKAVGDTKKVKLITESMKKSDIPERDIEWHNIRKELPQRRFETTATERILEEGKTIESQLSGELILNKKYIEAELLGETIVKSNEKSLMKQIQRMITGETLGTPISETKGYEAYVKLTETGKKASQPSLESYAQEKFGVVEFTGSKKVPYGFEYINQLIKKFVSTEGYGTYLKGKVGTEITDVPKFTRVGRVTDVELAKATKQTDIELFKDASTTVVTDTTMNELLFGKSKESSETKITAIQEKESVYEKMMDKETQKKSNLETVNDILYGEANKRIKVSERPSERSIEQVLEKRPEKKIEYIIIGEFKKEIQPEKAIQPTRKIKSTGRIGRGYTEEQLRYLDYLESGIISGARPNISPHSISLNPIDNLNVNIDKYIIGLVDYTSLKSNIKDEMRIEKKAEMNIHDLFTGTGTEKGISDINSLFTGTGTGLGQLSGTGQSQAQLIEQIITTTSKPKVPTTPEIPFDRPPPDRPPEEPIKIKIPLIEYDDTPSAIKKPRKSGIRILRKQRKYPVDINVIFPPQMQKKVKKSEKINPDEYLNTIFTGKQIKRKNKK